MRSLWSKNEAAHLDDLGLLVYASRLLGAVPTLVQGGGGNTSVKRTERDFRGRAIEVLRVKASGYQLATVDEKGFTGVRLEDLLALREREEMRDEDMVAYVAHCVVSPDSPRPSIETLLHAFVPARYVLHSHADAILSFANNARAAELIADVLGAGVAVVPYCRPGFRLARAAAAAAGPPEQAARSRRAGRQAGAAVLMHHGLVTWADGCEDAYERHIELVSRAEAHIRDVRGRSVIGAAARGVDGAARRRAAAEAAPVLRGAASARRPMVLAFDDSDEILAFAANEHARAAVRRGPATPEHVMSTKPWPLVVSVPHPFRTGELKTALKAGVEQFEREYEAYVRRHDPDLSPHDPAPRVVIVPGLGMWGIGASAADAEAAREVFRHTAGIVTGAEAVGAYRSIPEADIFEIEYWPLELYKLKLRPKPRELQGRIALVTGAARGIGLAIARRLLEEDACVVLADIDQEALARAGADLGQQHPGRVETVPLDVTDEAAVAAGLRAACLRFGGLDVLVSNAGIAPVGAVRDLAREVWERSLAVNATGHFLVAREAVRVLLAQGRGGSLVFVTTKNALAPGRDFGAYSCAKAAEAQLCRILAIEHGSDKIRANMINPDAVFTDLWSPEVRANRARAYGVPVEELEAFCRERTLLKESVTVQDVAEAALYLASDRSRVTTGCILTVDAGVREAFPR